VKFVSEIENDQSVTSVDASGVIRETVTLADKGFWDIKLNLPGSRRKLTVRQLVKLYRLEKLLLDPPATL